MNNRSIPSTHAERQITDLSVKQSFTLYPFLSPYSQTELQTEKQIHLLRVGWVTYGSSRLTAELLRILVCQCVLSFCSYFQNGLVLHVCQIEISTLF